MSENHPGVTESDNAWTLSIRYEGGDAADHAIDLNQLGQSLQGLARVLAVSAHFAQTGKYNKQLNALSVRVLACPVSEHHCYEVSAFVRKALSSAELWSGLGTGLFMAVVNHVFNRTKEQELKHLSAALEKSLGQQGEAQTRMLATIERLADALLPAVRQTLAPIGQSVASINIRSAGKNEASVHLDAQTKALAAVPKDNQITAPMALVVVISELDMLNGSCKVTMEDDPDSRISAVIVDPVVTRPGNAYADAMTYLKFVTVTAKAEIDQDGCIVKLFISDVQAL